MCVYVLYQGIKKRKMAKVTCFGISVHLLIFADMCSVKLVPLKFLFLFFLCTIYLLNCNSIHFK